MGLGFSFINQSVSLVLWAFMCGLWSNSIKVWFTNLSRSSVLLGEVKSRVYISVLLYSNKLRVHWPWCSSSSSLYFFFLFFLAATSSQRRLSKLPSIYWNYVETDYISKIKEKYYDL